MPGEDLATALCVEIKYGRSALYVKQGTHTKKGPSAVYRRKLREGFAAVEEAENSKSTNRKRKQHCSLLVKLAFHCRNERW